MNKTSKTAILSISLLIIMASAVVSPVLATIKSNFPNVDEIYIKMIITLPAVFIIPITLLTGKLVFLFKKKSLIIVGSILYVIGGVGGGLVNSIWTLLALRAVMGIGIGLMLPLARGLIADFFEGDERSEMMGFATSFNNLGGIIATVFAGWLSIYSWRFPFLIYFVGLFVLYMVVFHLPNQEILEKTNIKVQVNKNVWFLGFGLFYVMQVFYAIPAVISIYVEELNFGTGLVSGIVISLVTLGSLVFAIFFQKIKHKLKGMTSIFGLSLLTLGMYIVAISPNIYILGLSMLLIGFGLGILSPMLYLLSTTESKPKDVTFALAIMSSFSFLGQFSSPIIMTFIQNLTNQNNPNSPFAISTILGIIGLIAIVVNKKILIYKEENN